MSKSIFKFIENVKVLLVTLKEYFNFNTIFYSNVYILHVIIFILKIKNSY